MSLKDCSTPVFTNTCAYNSVTGRMATVGDGTYDTRLNNYHLLTTSNTTGATTRTCSYVYNDKGTSARS